MASPASHSHLRLLTALAKEATVRGKVPGAFFEPSELALPGYRSGIRDIDTRESWGSVSADSAPARWMRMRGLKLEHPDRHEPTANVIIVVACLLMFAAAMWWGSAQLHDRIPSKETVAAVRDGPGKS
ncbi:hypothetical protein DES53_11682 [Roseimicrobium gellanilyticum]|uniref:Uncharacterized protein n=1 Tax=Roseimicrobium gellanilyticum TaxID=748857 RepID=A0A366H5Z6_9BACT|nr:hypothetical protein [Roseimicrobium gellanilyticum]RBP36643.1 hypothetical protein DES53_11682 [Roseimicrobium gellanilyticum]